MPSSWIVRLFLTVVVLKNTWIICQSQTTSCSDTDKDCSDVCYGTRDINPCGYCIPSTRSDFDTYGMDCAGICFGDHVFDKCGQCLTKSSSQWNLCLTAPPTRSPTPAPSSKPTQPTMKPTRNPTTKPTAAPTARPTVKPTYSPSNSPVDPPISPTNFPSNPPTIDGFKSLNKTIEQFECTEFESIKNLSSFMTLNLCGIDEEYVMIGITMDNTRWAAVGFKNDDFDESNAMNDVYAIVIDGIKNEIKEYVLSSSTPPGKQLESTVLIINDYILNNRRQIDLIRKRTISKFDLHTLDSKNVSYYYDFNNFKNCQDDINIIYSMGQNQGDYTVSYHGNNRGISSMIMESTETSQCDNDDTKDIIQNFFDQHILLMVVIFIVLSLIAIFGCIMTVICCIKNRRNKEIASVNEGDQHLILNQDKQQKANLVMEVGPIKKNIDIRFKQENVINQGEDELDQQIEGEDFTISN